MPASYAAQCSYQGTLVVPSSIFHGKRVFVFGGYYMPEPTFRYFDINECEWRHYQFHLINPLCDTAVCMLREETAIICGGAVFRGFSVDITTAGCTEICLRTYEKKQLPDMIVSRAGHAAVRFQGAIIVIGGNMFDPECERLCIDDTHWREMATPNRYFRRCSAAVVNDSFLYAVDNNLIDPIQWHVELYDGTMWTEVGLSTPLGERTYCRLVPFEYDGKLAVFDKYDGRIMSFDPITKELILVQRVEYTDIGLIAAV